VAVLGWVRGQPVHPDELTQALRRVQLERVVNRAGSISVQRFSIWTRVV
jgi:hypothetical protein